MSIDIIDKLEIMKELGYPVLLGTSRKSVIGLTLDLPVEERAQDLLQRLTLQEKVLLMCDYSSPIPRLGIKRYNWWNEALHGVGRAGLATVFPQAIGMAATLDDCAVRQAFECVSDEARAKYHHSENKEGSERYQGLTFWTPNVNIFRDPRWGRGQETLSLIHI